MNPLAIFDQSMPFAERLVVIVLEIKRLKAQS